MMTRRLTFLSRQLIIFVAVLTLLLSSAQSVSALFVGPSTIVINGVFTDWGSPASGVYRRQDSTNTGTSDGAGFAGTPADINYFWNAMSTQSGGSSSASPTNLIQNIYYRIDTFTTGVIKPGQIYNLQLNLGVAGAGKADHLLQIWVLDTATPKVSIVMSSYGTPYPAIGAFTSGTLTGRVSNIASPYPGYSGAVDANATGAYGKYNGTNYGIEVKIPVSWFGSAYGGLIKSDGTGSPTYYGTIFTSTGNLGSVGTVKDTINKSDGTPVYFVVNPVTGETNFEDLKSVNITATKTDSIFSDVSPTGASPGDVLLYTVIVTNSGSSTANNVVFQDTITDTNLTWCDNVTVVPARTFVNSSNGVQVTIGNMAAGSSVTITFRALIINTPAKVSNQGTVSGSNFASVPTDDPDTLLASDPTSTPISPTDMVEPYKTWALTTDTDGNGYPSPGDTITYTVSIENVGNGTAENVTFTDIPDLNSTLVTNSVTTTSGTVFKGNGGSDTSVIVRVGDIPAGQASPVTVTFKVRVNNPLPFGVTQLSNQGFVSGNNFPVDPTDDPTDQSYDNPTVTPLTAAPLIEAYKRYELTDDAGTPGIPDVGDNLTYIITITNKGNQNAENVTFRDDLTADIRIIAGSINTNQGAVTTDNSTYLYVDFGTLPGGDYTVNTSFKVTIQPAASGGISNQGFISGNNFTTTKTDDPNTHTANDATYTALAGAHLSVSKSAILADDADNNNVPSPGDTLQYIVAINNNGGSAATGVVFKDTPGSNTSLVAGTVSKTQGSVLDGNDPLDTKVEVSIGTLEAGSTHSICLVTFEVTIDNPFPVNTDNISNQGIVTATGLTAVPTDDPNTDASPDATVTTVYADPFITATKIDTLVNDTNGDGYPGPGDTLQYTIVITNSGTTAARSVLFQDTITDTYLTLVGGSVTVTPPHTITYPATKTFQVDLGDIDVGPSSAVTITFQANIAGSVPAGVNKVTNQGLVSGSNFPGVPTDDPRTLLASDPTSTAITPTDMVEPYKTWALTTDADHNGIPSPGDTLTYTVTLENVGNHDASGVIFNDIPDPNSTLVEGSVTTTLGTVTKGNLTGDSAVTVNLGTLPGSGGDATITFRVIVTNPLPSGVTQLSNQGFVSGDHFAVDPTDDPTDQSYDNPTVTPLTAAPLIEAYKRYELTDDLDQDGKPGVGDNLTYIITVINKGNQNATGVSFSDTVDTNTSLIEETIITSQGTVTSTPTGLSVNIGTIPGGDYTVNISFKVTITGGLGGLSNQGDVTGTNFTSTHTDDPNTHTVNDPTYTALAGPHLSVTKSAILAIDADNNNVPSPGDTLQYIVAINNNGGSAATVANFTDTPDTNTSLVVGSVSTTQGDVVLGNSSGNTTVDVNVGTLQAGPSHNICLVTFDVLITSPLPDDISTISNYGTVTATGINKKTDDPNTEASPDNTDTMVYAQPVIYATKTDSLVNDINNNGIAEPGDTLQYAINITNTGTTAATSVVFTDPITSNISLTGYLTVPPGSSIGSGSVAGDPSVEVSMPTINVGDDLSIVFRATIDNPLPAGVNHISNQGYVSGANFSEISTDDPRTDLKNDATGTPVTAIPFVEPYKTWALTSDADNNGYPSPGDTLTYSVVIENTGGQNATGVVFNDIPDANSVLIAGSVTTDLGVVTLGNGSGDNSILVNVGTLPGAHGSATITFRVKVNSVLPTGVSYLSNQGFVSGTNFPSDPTDDPQDDSYDNPTMTPLTASPFIRAAKSYQLSYDANNDGLPGPGDNLTYIIDIVNNGNQNASGVNFTDAPGSNTTLFAGSVTTSQGFISHGNTSGDTGVEVNLGTLLGGGGSATISFTVRIDGGAVDSVSNQGNVAGGNFIPALTDDPGTTKLGDATETYLATPILTPSLHVTKAAILAIDADKTGLPSPGDTIQYIITINNTGNGAAQNIVFTDTPDPSTTLVAGSVSATQGGTVVSGNTAGNTVVSVNIPTLPGGSAHSVCLVTFSVKVNNPLPAGVSSISNQGTVSGANFDPAQTEDPGITGAPGTPTITTIYPGTTPPPTPPTPQPGVDPKSMLPITSHSSTIAAGSKNWPLQPSTDQTSAIKGKPVDLPSFKTSNLVINETEEGHLIYVDVNNTGKAAGTYTLNLKINGYTHGVKYLRLNPAASGHVEWLISSDEPGTYTVEIDGLSGTYYVDGLKGANRLINPDIVLIISMALILASLMLAVVYILRKRQNWYS